MLGLRDLAGGPGPGFSCKPVSSSQLKASARKLRVCAHGRLEPSTTTNTRDLRVDLEFQWKRNEGTAPGNETKAI